MRCWIFAFVAMLTGCASAITVTYRSEPPGAMIYEGSRALGYAPINVAYGPDESFKRGACMLLRAVEARWVSGAATSPMQTNVCGNIGYSQEVTFLRPNVVGRDLDVQWAIHLQQQTLAQQHADAAAQAGAAAEFANAFRAVQSVHCTSSQVGSSVMTNCY